MGLWYVTLRCVAFGRGWAAVGLNGREREEVEERRKRGYCVMMDVCFVGEGKGGMEKGGVRGCYGINE